MGAVHIRGSRPLGSYGSSVFALRDGDDILAFYNSMSPLARWLSTLLAPSIVSIAYHVSFVALELSPGPFSAEPVAQRLDINRVGRASRENLLERRALPK